MATLDLSPAQDLSSSLLIALDQTNSRDELDSFVLTGGVTSVEDILNDLIPNGQSRVAERAHPGSVY